MADIELGWRPIDIAPIFSADQGWTVTFEPKVAPPAPLYPSGTTVTARIYADDKRATILAPPMKEWPATIVGNNVTFSVPPAETNTVDAKRYMRIMIEYPTGQPFCWAHGKVEHDD
jgi:hypothetical protein